MTKNAFTPDGGPHRPDRVRNVSDGLKRLGEFEAAEMLTNYAALLRERESAVGEYLANIDAHGGVRWIHGAPPHGTKLYSHPVERESAKAEVTDEMVCRADVAQREFFESTPFTGDSDRLTHESVRAALEAVAPMLASTRKSCDLCDCTGDIHDQTGEWRGECPYCKPVSARVPEGWMLVPVMPTPKMLGAMRSTSINRHSDMYQAALTAAPKPETRE